MPQNTPIPDEPRHAYKPTTLETIIGNTILVILAATLVVATAGLTAPSLAVNVLIPTVFATGILAVTGLATMILIGTCRDLGIFISH